MKIKALNIFFAWVIKIFIAVFIYYVSVGLINIIPDEGQTMSIMTKSIWIVLINVLFAIIIVAISTNSLESLNKDNEGEQS